MVKEIRFCKFKRLVVWTKGKFGTGNALLRYGVHLHSEALGTGNGLLWYGVHLQSAGCLASPHVVPQKKNRPLDSLAGRFYAQYFIKPANGMKVSSDIRKKEREARKWHETKDSISPQTALNKKGMQKNCIPIINSPRQSNHNYLISIRRVA